ncbi:TetR/AcrR family transcriptional regulator [Seleniivibrio sp.]|uniref:TetR/AcrR family transcriptional regulator n=1 Tax=Seleniivibrio sp. TaxID=2898801 RepID=UPI0025D654DC|nr:TetR/AcrR family transcriptional regulator [Seleniivibrio sp.]MCD8554771.1 TetR/AcrR family transcriptional regulator [Seleniivibrio sp.]
MKEKKISLTKEKRDALKKTKIIEAARKCVAYKGFHATSMNEIAKCANMSVGHIYHYFDNKNEIINGIVEHSTQEHLQWIASTALRRDIACFHIEYFKEKFVNDHEERALLLEIHAEAARNTVVAEMLTNADILYRNLALLAVKPVFPNVPEDELKARIELMANISESFLMRSIKKPSADSAKVDELLRHVIDQIWTE